MNPGARLIRAIVLTLLAALLVGLIVAAPVMREPTGTISATNYFGNGADQ